MPYEDETYEDEQPEPGHLDDEEELGEPRRPVDGEEPEEELEIDRPAYVPPQPTPAKGAPSKKKKAKPKRKKKAAPRKKKAKKSRGKARKSKKRSAKKARGRKKRR